MANLFMKQGVILAILFTGALTASAERLTVSDPTQFASSYGADYVTYDGDTGEYTGEFALASPSGNGLTLDIEEPTTELTLSGQIKKGVTGAGTSIPSAFVKNGPGTLIWASPYDITFDSGGCYNCYGVYYPLGWNDDGSLIRKKDDVSYGFVNFTIANGVFVYNSPGNTLNGYNVIVGSTPTTTTPELRVLGGTFSGGNTLGFNFGRRAEQENASAKIYVGTNGTIKTDNLWGHHAPLSGTRHHATVEIDGGKFLSTQKGQVCIASRG